MGRSSEGSSSEFIIISLSLADFFYRSILSVHFAMNNWFVGSTVKISHGGSLDRPSRIMADLIPKRITADASIHPSLT
jgi:hypothetical protein